VPSVLWVASTVSIWWYCISLDSSCVACELVGTVAVVVGVDGHSRGDELVDTVQDIGGQSDIGGGEVGLQLFHGARSHDG
jgi:hypothetical protein